MVAARAASLAFAHLWVPLDAQSFRNVAAQLGAWDFHEYEGARPPVYPLLLVLTHGHDHVTWVVQSILGCASAVMIARVTEAETKSRAVGIAAGAFVAFGFYALCFEAAIMSECLGTALVSASLFMVWKIFTDEASLRRALLLGVLTGLAILTRPIFMYLVVVYAIALRRGGIRHVAVFAAASCGLVLAWSFFNWTTLGYFGPTTLLGYNLTNHCGAFIERAPPEYAEIRDVYLHYRAPRLALYGDHMQTIWDAFPEMLHVTHLSYAGLSKRLFAMCVALIVQNPGAYLASVVRAFGRFWLAPNCRASTWLFPSGPMLARLWDLQEAIFIGSKLALLALAPLALWRRFASCFTRVVVAVVLGGAVFQAILELGENDRYSVPLQPWAACAALLLAHAAWRATRRPIKASA